MNTSSTPNSMRKAMWTCGVLMTAIAVALPLRYGVSWWTVLLAVVLLACPVGLVWTALRFGRGDPFPPIPPNERRKP
jgi:predicted cobalt transporter CbtA